MHVYLFVDTRENCDVSLTSKPFNSRHIPGLSQVNKVHLYMYYSPDSRKDPLAKKWSYLHFSFVYIYR